MAVAALKRPMALFLSSLALVAVTQVPSFAVDVTGKVMAVFYEPVTVNSKVMDKVSVTLRPCDGSAPLKTFSYSPSAVSDDQALGFLFNDMTTAARAVETKNQFMNSVSGHVTLSVNEQNTILKSTFWGYNWECGRNLDAPGGTGPGAGPMGGPAMGNPGMGGGMPPRGVQASPPPTSVPSVPSVPGVPGVPNPLRRFGF